MRFTEYVPDSHNPLERLATLRLLIGVQSRPLSRGVIVGCVAAAATSGGLIAMGHRTGAASLPFAAIGAILFRQTPTSVSIELTVVGLVVHVTMMFLWSLVFVTAVERGVRHQITAALLVGVGQFILSWIVASISGRAIASVLPLGDRIMLALILSAALAVGMRFAPPPSQSV